MEHMWRSGDSVRVVLSPLDGDGTESTLYAAGGAWALLRFVSNPPEGIAVRLYHPDTKVEMPIVRFPASAPEIQTTRR